MAKIISAKRTGTRSRQKCITVSADDGLFVLEGGIVTHNCPEKILKFYSKLQGRIVSRFGNNYLARCIIDSSVSNSEDVIQSWIDHDAPENNANYIFKGSRWFLYPEEFTGEVITDKLDGPLYGRKVTVIPSYDTAFRVYKGGSGKPAKPIFSKEEEEGFAQQDLLWVPNTQKRSVGDTDFRNLCKVDPNAFLQDYCSISAGNMNRLFYREEWVSEPFDNTLRNIYGAIEANADLEPEHLIWDQIKGKFFNTIMGRTKYYNDPTIPRTVSVDQSKAKDVTCIAMSHVERDPNFVDEHTGRPLPIYVTDFTVVLVPAHGHINMDAIKFFIHDLRNLGGLNIVHCSFDHYQSDAQIQWLKRDGFEAIQLSADTDNDLYYNFYDLVTHGRWHCGKNIFTKNNMLSVHEVHRKNTGSVKIDHTEGDLVYTFNEANGWNTDLAGQNAKDCTDAIVESIGLLNKFSDEFVPTKVWDPKAEHSPNHEQIKNRVDSRLSAMGVCF